MKNLKKILALLVVTAMVAVIPGVCGMVAWAAEATLVSEDVMEIAEDVVYDAESVEEIVYEETIVEEVVCEEEIIIEEIVEEVVYEEEIVDEITSVEEEVYETVEGHIYFDGIDPNVIAMVIDETTASVYGEIVANDVAPIIRNDRTMLPARFVAENLGAEVAWDAEARVVTVKSEEVEIKLTIDSAIATVNGVEETLDSPAFIENDRTYTPVRYIAEKLGATVDWFDDFKMVMIYIAAEDAEEEVTEEEVVEEEVVEEVIVEETVIEETIIEETVVEEEVIEE